MVTSPRYRALTLPGWVALSDPDVSAYVRAVETADGQPLELPVRKAIHEFITGCKADGIWPAIKASCILAGARTLAGALVPLVGTAPTNVNFVSGDYNRKTGLVGNGPTKYLSSNRANNADPQNSKHVAAFVHSGNSWVSGSIFGADPLASGRLDFNRNAGINYSYIVAASSTNVTTGNPAGFVGINRSGASSASIRLLGSSIASSTASSTPEGSVINLFRRNYGPGQEPINARLAFYSIGESLDLALLDARVSQLITTFAAVIP